MQLGGAFDPPRPLGGGELIADGDDRRDVDPAVASQLSVLTRPAKAGDALPSGDVAGFERAFSYAGVDVAAAREVTASNGEPVHLVPADGGACVIGGGTAFCTSAQDLAGADQASLCSPTVPAGETQLEWIMPDGASNSGIKMANGTTTSYPTGSNVYIETLPDSGPLPVSITWTSDGAQHSAPSSVPAGAQDQACMHPSNLPPASELPHTTPGVVTTPSSAAPAAPSQLENQALLIAMGGGAAPRRPCGRQRPKPQVG